jgi:D-alanyl-lipoteichoic acid acyltransferase DltB (MBOAT superfamily)
MLFNSLEFWVFFGTVALAAYSVPASWSRAVLVAGSFAFYGTWDPLLMLLLAGCVVCNYFTGIAISRLSGSRARTVVVLAVVANLSLLGLFKYYGFVVGTVTNLLHLPKDAFDLHIILPVAISFYTFEAISYNVDIYRGKLKARGSLVDFALFMSFFPHLVAGPIIRPAHFFPQLTGRPAPSGDDIGWGMVQVMKGLIKKTVFADNFAIIANSYFNLPVGHGGMLAAWVGTLAFSMQIYFDFSGYTDIARGCARLLGYEFPSNFERPYLAHNIAEFWRRWHISLSTWLRDYLYIPLGGNRHGSARTYTNLLLTMGLGGLWHGASWNFVIWGLYHGALLVLHRIWCQVRGEARGPWAGSIGNALGAAFTFVLVTIGWVAFRAPDCATAWQILGQLFASSVHVRAEVPTEFVVLLGVAVVWLVLDRDRRLQAWLGHGAGVSGTLKVSSALALALVALELFSRTDIVVPFIYFRF